MSKGLNKMQIIGHLGSDPDIRETRAGACVANLSVATTDVWTDRESGDRKEQTEWHRVVLFGKLGEVAGNYLGKGQQVYVEGRLQTRKWQDRDGADRYTTEVIGSEMQMLGGGGSKQSTPPAEKSAPQNPRQPAPEPVAEGVEGDSPFGNFDSDDTPF